MVLVLTLVLHFTMINTNTVLADENYESIITELIKLENDNNWDRYPDLWCDEQRDIFENLFIDDEFVESQNGILCVDTATINDIKEIEYKEIDGWNLVNDSDKYENIKYYVVEIDYKLKHEQFGFEEGINYRLIALGKENNDIKVLAVSEAPGSIVSNHFIKTNANNNTRAFNPGYSYDVAFNKKLPKSIKVYVSDEKTIYDISLTMYVKRVLPNEMVIYTSPIEALKAQVICIQQYAVWNTVYYSKYPNGGYNVMDTQSDQVYNYMYDQLEIEPRKKVDDAYAAVSTICMITKSNLALFESGYVKNKTYDTTPNIGKMYQDGAVKLANEGRKFNEILSGYYNNRVLHFGGNIEKIKFTACYK